MALLGKSLVPRDLAVCERGARGRREGKAAELFRQKRGGGECVNARGERMREFFQEVCGIGIGCEEQGAFAGALADGRAAQGDGGLRAAQAFVPARGGAEQGVEMRGEFLASAERSPDEGNGKFPERAGDAPCGYGDVLGKVEGVFAVKGVRKGEDFMGPSGIAAPVVEAGKDAVASAWVEPAREVKMDVGGEVPAGLGGFEFFAVVDVAEQVDFRGDGCGGKEGVPAEVGLGAKGGAAGYGGKQQAHGGGKDEREFWIADFGFWRRG